MCQIFYLTQLMRKPVRCKNQFKGDFREQIHIQANRSTEINLPVEAKLASSIWWN